MATAHFLLGDLESAIIAFRRSLQMQHTNVTAFGLSQLLLCQGKYEEGFELYENRFSSHAQLNWIQHEKMPMPRWQGESLKEKTLLVWTEQGFGDCIQFTRIITQLVDEGASVDIMLQKQHKSLNTLLGTLRGVSDVSVVGDNKVELKRRYDYHTPLMSLMQCTHMTPETIPARKFPYLFLSDDAKSRTRNEELLQQLEHKKGDFNVGIVWSTALTESFKKKDYMHFSLKDKKSLRPDDISPLRSAKGVTFFSLHVAKSEATQYVIDKYDVVDMAPFIHDFIDTAVIVDEMDLIISVDTAVAHLAGAFNKPVINLLPYAADWRWQMHREDTTWYPSMRLLRQPCLDDWQIIAKRLQTLLSQIIVEHKASGNVNIWSR